MNFAHDEFLVKFDGVFSGKHDTDADREDLETLAASLKPLSTWAALDILQEAREACGGAGFLIENRLTGLRADLDIYVTFEGDNNILLQLVAKRLLVRLRRSSSRARMPRRSPASPSPRRRRRPTTAPGCAPSASAFATSARPRAACTELRDAETQRAAAHRPGREHGRRARGPAASGIEAVEEGCRRPLQLAAERTHRGGSRPRRAAPVGGVHARRSRR